MGAGSSTRKLATNAANDVRASAGPMKTEPAAITMAQVFGPGGMLAKCHPGYEYRAAQLEMAEMVDEAFGRHQHALIEAGTGTGKTLAYLVPAIRSGRRVVISTATKSLQEQLFQKDIPFLRKHFAPELKVALVKGRNNFVCREKVRLMQGQPVLRGMDELDWFAQIRDWEKLTETGDRSELNFLPDNAELWSRIDARRETCTGQKCPQFQECFLTKMRQRAQEADILIVNHHLFFADLALKQDDFGSILPEYGAVIFDEAHEIEDVASDYFGQEISSWQFDELARDGEQILRMLAIGSAVTRRPLAQIRERAHAFFEAFPEREGRFPFERRERQVFLDRNREAYDGLLAALKRLETEMAAMREKPEELLNLARRAAELRRGLAFLLESDEKVYVYWFERRGKGIFVVATPIDVSEIMREKLFEQFDTIVLTSATLAVGARFDYAKQRLGISAAKEKVLPQEFDYANQALLYVPESLPDVRDANFSARATAEIAEILKLTRGRAFCLFTSYAQMKDVHERLGGIVPFPLLLQGTAPRTALLDRFRSTPGAVLLATASFWQGVDVPGSQLSCVIVDRLPFAVPTDPIVAARVRALADDGQNAFGEYQVPKAVLALKQGFGRLIRSRADRGVLCILDNRIQRMQYGKIFLESLPEYTLTHELPEVARFAETL